MCDADCGDNYEDRRYMVCVESCQYYIEASTGRKVCIGADSCEGTAYPI